MCELVVYVHMLILCMFVVSQYVVYVCLLYVGGGKYVYVFALCVFVVCMCLWYVDVCMLIVCVCICNCVYLWFVCISSPCNEHIGTCAPM